jgi:hypothetical protein
MHLTLIFFLIKYTTVILVEKTVCGSGIALEVL